VPAHLQSTRQVNGSGASTACESARQALGESLVGLFGEDEANAAEEMMNGESKRREAEGGEYIAAHRKVFEDINRGTRHCRQIRKGAR